MKKEKNSPAPSPTPSPGGLQLNLREIPGAVEIKAGFVRINWAAVRAAVSQYAQHPAISQLWTELARQWLGILQAQVGAGYQVFESEHLLLLTSQADGEAIRFLEIGDSAYERLERLLERKNADALGKHVVLIWKSRAEYYDYIAYFQGEGDEPRGASDGMHIGSGYRHTVINGQSQSTLRVLVHEMAHNMVADRPLPRWLNEGLAKFVEDMVPGYRGPLIDARQVRLQQRYWSWFGLDHFWDGSGFLRPSSQGLSYQLAEILFRNLAGDRVRSRSLGKFLATADRRDAGQAACNTCFNCSLADLIEEFLGPGEWEPKLASVA